MQEMPDKGCRHCCPTYVISYYRDVRGQGIILLTTKIFRMTGLELVPKPDIGIKTEKYKESICGGGGEAIFIAFLLGW